MSMSPMVVLYLKSALLYLGLGSTLGFLLSVPIFSSLLHTLGTGRWSLVHAHFNLLGFLLMLVFGIAYHTIPRFSGHGVEPHSAAIAAWQFGIFHAGLWILVAGFVRNATILQASGGTLLLLAIYLFIYNLWRTMQPPASRT